MKAWIIPIKPVSLYGVGGKSQVSVERDEDGKSVILTVFDQDQIGGGNTVYQMVNQIQRDPVISGKAAPI